MISQFYNCLFVVVIVTKMPLSIGCDIELVLQTIEEQIPYSGCVSKNFNNCLVIGNCYGP
jgi:hypothetical protein